MVHIVCMCGINVVSDLGLLLHSGQLILICLLEAENMPQYL